MHVHQKLCLGSIVRRDPSTAVMLCVDMLQGVVHRGKWAPKPSPA